MSSSSYSRVGFIGCGNIGEPMIFGLLNNAFSVGVYDIRKSATDKAVAAGAEWCSTPRQAAQGCDILCTCLPLPVHVRQAMLGEHGSLEAMRPGSIWIDCSTTDYHNTLHIAEQAKRKQVTCLEAPVSDLSHMGVDFCNIAFYVGGDEKAFQLCQKVFSSTGKKAFYVGSIGMAQNAKLLTNLLFYSALVNFGEGTAVVHAAGVPMHWWWQCLQNSHGCSQMVVGYAPLVFDGSYDDSCSLLIGEKDMMLTVEMGKELGVEVPFAEIVNAAYEEGVKRYDRSEGELIIVRVTEDDNNVEFRIPNFYAPSPYGKNKEYRHPPELERDEFGREWPARPSWVEAAAFECSEEQRQVIDTTCEYLALVNEAMYDEGYRLGKGMGLDDEQLREMIRWSCGASWISDYGHKWRAERKTMEKMSALVKAYGVRLRSFAAMERALRARHGW